MDTTHWILDLFRGRLQASIQLNGFDESYKIFLSVFLQFCGSLNFIFLYFDKDLIVFDSTFCRKGIFQPALFIFMNIVNLCMNFCFLTSRLMYAEISIMNADHMIGILMCCFGLFVS